MSNTLLESVVKKNRARLIPFMLALYVLAFLDRSNIGFAKETYQLDTGLSNEAYALGAGIFFVVYAFLGVPANLLMRKFGARKWIGCTTLLWGFCRRRWRGRIRKRNFCWCAPCWARRRRASFPE
jgi:MFS family permease